MDYNHIVKFAELNILNKIIINKKINIKKELMLGKLNLVKK